jgi:hypothetical protein
MQHAQARQLATRKTLHATLCSASYLKLNHRQSLAIPLILAVQQNTTTNVQDVGSPMHVRPCIAHLQTPRSSSMHEGANAAAPSSRGDAGLRMTWTVQKQQCHKKQTYRARLQHQQHNLQLFEGFIACICMCTKMLAPVPTNSMEYTHKVDALTFVYGGNSTPCKQLQTGIGDCPKCTSA